MRNSVAQFIALIISSASAATASNELDDLTARYNKNVDYAVAPIKDQYRKDLRALLDKYNKAGDVNGIRAVLEKLESLDGAGSPDPKIDFTNKSWICANHEFVFKKQNVGYKNRPEGKVPFTWRVLADRKVEVVGRDTFTSVPKTWVFDFSTNTLVDGEDGRTKQFSQK